MIKSQRKLLRGTGLLGVLLTLFVVMLEEVGALTPLERLLYDMRAKYCQIFVPEPTDKIVHFDIDDAAIASLGRWPWPRTLLARLTEELHRAGAKVVAFDVTFPDTDGPGPTGAFDDALDPSPPDRAFAEALRSCGRAVLAVSLEFQSARAPDPLHDAIVRELRQDLELRPEDLSQRLARRGITNVLPEKLIREFVQTREEVMLDRLLDTAAQGYGLQELKSRLLPHAEMLSRSPTLRLLRRQYDLARAITSLERKARPISAGLPPLLHCSNAQPPVAVIGDAAQFAGFVNYLPLDDGVVRRMPLWVEYRGKLVPQIGFLLACAMLDVDVTDGRQVELSADRIIIHPPHDAPIVIPVRTYPTAEYGEVGMQINIPWAGRKGWRSLYGTDADGNPRRHLSMNIVWDLCNKRDAIVINGRNADLALDLLLGSIDRERQKSYRDHPLPLDEIDLRQKRVRDAIAIADALFMDDFRRKPPQERAQATNQELNYVTTYNALVAIKQQYPILRQERDVLSHRLRREVDRRAVLIGSAATAGDAVPTSIDPMCPGPVVHGTIFNGIMTGRLLWEAPHWATIVIAIALGLLTTSAVMFMSPWVAMASVAATCTSYLALNGILLYDRRHMIFGLAAPVMATAVVWAGCTLFRYVLDRAERARITRRFRSYVDPALVNYVIENPDKVRLEGEKKELSIVFTDLRDFTRLTERLGEGVVGVLSEYMGEMVPVIRGCRGYVNKFLGDGIMCLFGAPIWHPDHAGDALAAVTQMNRALASFNDRLKARDLPRLTMRAGINTAQVIVGDAGADATDYTALGDGVNVAFRLESANKALGTSTLIGARTAELVNGRYLLRPVGRLHVVGKTEPLMTYEPLAPAEEATDEQRRIVEETEKVVRLYQSGSFGECLEAIVAAERRLGCSGRLFELYRQLCERYKSQIPIDFRGQIILEEK